MSRWPASASPERPMLRTLLVRFALVLFGIALLGVAELALRLIWSPLPRVEMAWTEIDPFREEGGMMVLKEPFEGSLRPVAFARQKPPETFRIFCFGGSTTFGYPLPADAAWPASLDQRLRTLYPGRKVEVINLGGTSYASARILGLMRGVTKYQPDLFIATFGHNEFVEDSFRVAVETRPGRAGWLRSLHLSRAMERLLPERRSPRRAVPVEPGGGGAAGFFFAPVLEGTVYKAPPERRQSVLDQLRGHLRAMVDLTGESGVGLVFATVPSSLINWPPEPDDGAPADPQARQRWEELVARGEAMEKDGKADAALALYREAARVWDGNASLAFRLGRMLAAEGRQEEALIWLERARDLDPAPVRATSVNSQAIREAAMAAKVPLADCARIFLRLAPTAEAEADLILDHVHPSVRGQAVMAREIWRAMTSLEGWGSFDAATEAGLGISEERRAGAELVLDGNLAFVWGQVYARKGLLERAEAMYRQAIALGNRMPFVRMYLADVLAEQGRTAEARGVLEDLAARQPGFAEHYPLLGALREQAGDLRGALDAYQKAFTAGNTDRSLLFHLGLLLVDSNRVAEATMVMERAASLYPGDCDLLALRGRVFETAGHPDEAIRVYDEVLKSDPACHRAWENLGVLQMDRGDWAGAERTFRAALKAPGPLLPNHHLNLGYVYYRGLGNGEKAVEQFSRYLEIQPDGAGNLPPELRDRILAASGKGRPGADSVRSAPGLGRGRQ